MPNTAVLHARRPRGAPPWRPMCSGCGKRHHLGSSRAVALTRNGAKAASWLSLSSFARRNGK